MRRGLDPAPGPSSRRPAADDARDLREGQAEGVVEHEDDALGRRQRLEDDKEAQAERSTSRQTRAMTPAGATNLALLAREWWSH